MIVSDKLSDSEGFSAKDREAHFKTLINLTDFAQLRLTLICIQFLDYQSSTYLTSHEEFKGVAKELGLEFGLY